MTDLTLKEYQKRIIENSRVQFPQCQRDWNIVDWTNAIAGEAGEACNIAKKVRRGDFKLKEAREAILKELADTICYCSLAMSYLNADIEWEVNRKFEEVKKRQICPDCGSDRYDGKWCENC